MGRGFTPSGLERAVKEALERRGFDVVHTGGPGDEGLDLIARRRRERLAVQCKRYDSRRTVAPRELRELLGAMAASKIRRGLFVTTSSFSPAARDFGAAHRIELVDSSSLIAWLEGDARSGGPPEEVRCEGSGCSYVAQDLGRWTRVWLCPRCGHHNELVPGGKDSSGAASRSCRNASCSYQTPSIGTQATKWICPKCGTLNWP